MGIIQACLVFCLHHLEIFEDIQMWCCSNFFVLLCNTLVFVDLIEQYLFFRCR